jgi:3-dehydroquinate dehydratase-2
MSKPVYILNGSNLNMLGRREPHLYGTTTLAQVQASCLALGDELGLDCEFRQTNHEGVMVEWLHEAFERDAALVINPAGFSFSSIAVFDAVKMIRQPVVEVHITNIHQRGELYNDSMISRAAGGVICGCGTYGYLLALRSVAVQIAQRADGVNA